ncbi:putative disease resistance protein RGA3 [Macadamia integrifolia]|uniref:putative disease resistance protein RGA3 n=1 Tax=Macadamia integrifolia TaxID=60698 RepID=UPI001C4F1B58|nr:putative disease resistance protein RGA3 [Macadamia integrifolia]
MKPIVSSMSNQFISFQVIWYGNSLDISVVFAKCLRVDHRSLWRDLVAGTNGRPRMILGDFNATLFNHERRGPGRFCTGAAAEFGAMVDATSMIQVPSSGRKFTWSNNRKRGNVSAILDRSFVNSDWLNSFSDSFPNLEVDVASAKADLEIIQERIEDEGMNDDLFNLEADAKIHHWKALENHEKMWVEKSRVKWLKEGDRNSRFYHVMAEVKRSKNAIHSIVRADETEIKDQDQVGNYIVDYFQVLDLEDLKIKTLPEEIGYLIHLRYLGLKCPALDEIPESIGNLQNLLTLDIRWPRSMRVLPSGILKLVELRHLMMSMNEIKVPPGIGIFSNLQSLTGLFARPGILEELSKLTQLKELQLNDVSEEHASELSASIMNMRRLLRLSIRTRFGEDEMLPMLDLSPPPFIRKLHLSGRLIDLLDWVCSMESLTKLTLAYSFQPEEALSLLLFLPYLKHLNLCGACNSKQINKEFCPLGGFPKLETLKVSSEKLVEWTEIEKGASPCLAFLFFHNSLQLMNLPEGLQLGIIEELRSLTQLRKLELKDVSEEHANELSASIMKMRGLVSLSLDSGDHRGKELLPTLELFSPPQFIRKLSLDGRLVDLPHWVCYMEKLTKLSLGFSFLPEEAVFLLQLLPNLKHLTLWEACKVKKMNKEFCPVGGFPKLEALVIASMKLMEWTEIEEGPCQAWYSSASAIVHS